MITTEQKEILQHVCFGVLMANGVIHKSPKYIAEKMKTKNDTLSAWQMLHSDSRDKIILWAHNWNFPLKKILNEIGATL